MLLLWLLPLETNAGWEGAVRLFRAGLATRGQDGGKGEGGGGAWLVTLSMEGGGRNFKLP